VGVDSREVADNREVVGSRVDVDSKEIVAETKISYLQLFSLSLNRSTTVLNSGCLVFF
jgi:hypothetical protein